MDASGQLLLKDHSVPIQKYKLEMANGVEYDIPVVVDYSNPAEGEAANLGFHKHIPGAAPAEGRTEPDKTARQAFLDLLKRAQQKG